MTVQGRSHAGLQAQSAFDALFPTCKVALVQAPLQMPETIISLDPGRTTGVVIATGPRDTEASRDKPSQWIVAEVVELPTLWRVLHTYKPASILFERFDPENPAANLEALDIRGIVKLYRDLTLTPKIHWQPREAKRFSSDQMLKANELWCRGLKHGRDAMRHLVWHLVKREDNVSLLGWTKSSVSRGGGASD